MLNKGAYIWNFGGRILPQIVFLLTNILLARILTPAEFGQIGVLSIFISISTTLTDAGFGGSLIKEEHITYIDLSTVFIYNFVVSIFLYIVLFCCANAIEIYFDIDGIAKVTRFLCLVFVINAWALIPKTILIKELRFKQIALVAIIGVFISSIVAICGAMNGWGVYALVAYQLIYALCDVVCFEYLTKYMPSFIFSISSFKKLFSFGYYTTLCNVIESAYTNIMTTLFGKFMNVNAAGYLYQAQKLEASATNSLAQTINTVSFPILTKLKNNTEIFYKESNSLSNNFAFILFPLFWCIVIYSAPITNFIFGREWIGSAVYLSYLMIGGIFYVMESLTRNYIKSLGEVKKLAQYTLLKRLFGLICIFAFLLIDPFYMLYGFILSTIVGYATNVYLYSKLIGIVYLKLLSEDLRPFFITLLFPIVFIVVHLMNFLTAEIIVVIFILLIYYLFLLPKISGVNIVKLLRHKNG